ncbi:GDP-L-fucose synthase family protein [Gordonia sp. DT101]|uniref:GDP-L-fucose synthase family protein n=1 Tax=Gordonia sp. DT101 TaxID=3416545 RepID=UPI003CF87959
MSPAVHPLGTAGRVFVAGHRGLVGSAIVRALTARGIDPMVCTRDDLDLRDRDQVFSFMRRERPEVVVLAAAKVGGIGANSVEPVAFVSENLQIQVNVLDAALEVDVPRVLFLGSSCVYPRDSLQPIEESALLTGPLEPTNEAYAIAKIAGLIQVQAVRRQYGLPWISAMPTNLYGPGDNFSPYSSHLVPALIVRYSHAVANRRDAVVNWGSGTPRRELMHVDDAAGACIHLLEHYDETAPVNVGTGEDMSIADIAQIVSKLTGFSGTTEWDMSRPDGMPRKVLDITTLHGLGWSQQIDLEKGIGETVDWYRRGDHVRR